MFYDPEHFFSSFVAVDTSAQRENAVLFSRCFWNGSCIDPAPSGSAFRDIKTMDVAHGFDSGIGIVRIVLFVSISIGARFVLVVSDDM